MGSIINVLKCSQASSPPSPIAPGRAPPPGYQEPVGQQGVPISNSQNLPQSSAQNLHQALCPRELGMPRMADTLLAPSANSFAPMLTFITY